MCRSPSSHCPETALYKTHSLRPPDIVRSNTRSSLDNSRSYYHLTKEKVPKENPLRRGSPAGGKGKGGAKERRLRRLKEKVTSPFSPSLRGIESAVPMENPMGLPQGLGKPLRGLPHFQHPSAHLLFPLRLSPFPEGKIFWGNTLTGGLDYQRVYFHFSAVIIACPKEICKPSGQASFTAPCRPFLAGAAVAPAAVQSPDRAAAPSPFQAEDADAPASVLPRSPASDRCRPSDAR